MSNEFTKQDRQFMRSIKVADAPTPALVPWAEHAAALELRDHFKQRMQDYRTAASNWCVEAERNHKAFVRASIIAGVMALAAIVGWLR